LSGWRLPTIDELAKLYDPTIKSSRKIRKGFRLTGSNVWSSTKRGSSAAWYFLFYNGVRSSQLLTNTYLTRALCVRENDVGR
jgi:hypothetical protein